jgi:tRNA (mo5U34)-methyltransferase
MKTIRALWQKVAAPSTSAEHPDKSAASEPGFQQWLASQIEAEDYWFHRIDLPGGMVTPGWNDPRTTKLPCYGLPEDLTGMRVLDIGHAEGFFSFEAERRGAAEVVGIENFPPMLRKFNICRAALNSKAQSFRASVYDLNPKAFGTFDLVFFYGVLYHLRHPLLALEKIQEVCTGTLLMQTAVSDDYSDVPRAEFHPFGIESGPPEDRRHDPTCFWFPNPACCAAMLEHADFKQVERLPLLGCDVGIVFRAKAARQERGAAPDEMKAPWS